MKLEWLGHINRLVFRGCCFSVGLLRLQLKLGFKWRHFRFLYNCVAALQRADNSGKYVLVSLIFVLNNRRVLPLDPANRMLFDPQLFLICAALGRHAANFQLLCIPSFCHLDSQHITLSAVDIRSRYVGQKIVVLYLNLYVLLNCFEIIVTDLHWSSTTL